MLRRPGSKRSVRFISLALAASLVTACGSSGGDIPGDPSGGGSGHQTDGSGTVGPTGGTVSLSGGASVIVPSGALSSSTTITVAAASATAPSGAISSVYAFGPSGTTFAAPVTVTFPVPAGTPANAVAYWSKPGSTTEWEALPAVVNGTTATIQVTHFSSGFIGAPCTTVACTAQDFVPVAVARRYAHSGTFTFVHTEEALTYASPGWTRRTVSSNVAGDQIVGLVLSGGAVAVSSNMAHNGSGAQTSSFTYSPPLVLFPADTTPGATWSSTSSVAGSGTSTVSKSFTVNGVESVTVQAGTFTAVKLTVAMTQTNAPPTTSVSWWAAGVGLVKSVSYPTATPALTATSELTAWTPMACAGGTCACNALANGAPLVTPAFVASALPAGSGGSIVDGTYFLTANRVYTGPGGTVGPMTGADVRTTYAIQSGRLDMVTWHTGLSSDVRASGWVSSAGSVLQTCGPLEMLDNGKSTTSFTATPTQIQFIVDNHCTSAPCDLGGDAILSRQ